MTKEPAGRIPWKPFWRTFLLLALIPIVVLVVYTRWLVAERIDEIGRAESLAVDLQAQSISQALHQVVVDICTLAGQNEVRDYLATGESSYVDDMSMEYLALARNSRVYDQIRFINAAGMEVTRINYDGAVPRIVAPEDLQDKSGRYYFTETLGRERGEIYVSPLDLNVEQEVIEFPYKPIIRVGTPIYDDRGRSRGIVLVNFLADTMLNRIARSAVLAVGEPMILNGDGYWLVNSDPRLNWGFMFSDRRDERMPVLFPEEWGRIAGQPRGDVRTDTGLYTYRHYYPLRNIGDCAGRTIEATDDEGAVPYHWILASHVPQPYLDGIERRAILTSLVIGAPVLLLLAVGTRALNVVGAQRQRHQANLEAMARTDPLTKLANRNTFEEQLLQEFGRDTRHNRRFAVLYLDLDGFKAVNDSQGHEAGDQVLKDVAAILQSSCRSVDTPARLGGDEFAILLSEIAHGNAAAAVGAKIRNRVNRLDYEGLTVGVSVGVAVWPDDSKNPSDIVNLADEAMYEAKRSGKNRVHMAANSAATGAPESTPP